MNTMNWVTHAEWIAVMVAIMGGFFMLNAKIDQQSARTDKLYEMFIDLVKETRTR
jgi:hypothetical protein